MNVSMDVVFTPGQIYRRRDLHAKVGGQRQGGISTPANAPFIFLITGDSGKQHGYSDDWTDDGIFLYTGEGQRGDMRFVAGNRAIRDHIKDGKTLQVFEQQKKDKRFLRYLGEMEYAQHTYREALDILMANSERQSYSTCGRSGHSRPIQPLWLPHYLVRAQLLSEVGGLRFRRNQPSRRKGCH